MCRAAVVLVALVLGAVAGAEAQQGYAVPQSPAFTFLDVAPTRIERPTTARDLAIGLVNGIGPDGRVQQGIAVEATPWPWIPGLSIPAASYGRIGPYMLANLALSLGSARAAGDTASTDIAVGLRTTILDRSDPMADPDFRNTLRAALLECNSEEADASDAAIRACAASRNTELRREWLEQHWNATSLSVALATAVRLRESALGRRDWRGISGWGALALPLTDHGQLMVQARVDRHASIGTIPSATSWRTGARAVFGSAIVNGFLELEYDSEPIPGTDSRTGWTGGVEFRATEETWISTGFGRGRDLEDADRVTLIADIRWRISRTPSFAP